jgi:DNA sulfur modification protein DndE
MFILHSPFLKMKSTPYIFFFFGITLLTTSCKQATKADNQATGNLSKDSVISLAKSAYLFGYPLVLMHETMLATTNVPAPVPGKAFAPVNQFGHFRSFPDASFKEVVKPNVDTYYSSAWLDLKNEPLVLTVPNTNGRYYLLPMLDAYSNIFASPGKRTTGTEAGKFLITSASYNGTVPEGMKKIVSPTDLVWILGRTQVNSEEDGKKVVHPIQDGFTLTPLRQWGQNYQPALHTVDTTLGKTAPPAKVENMDIADFFNLLNKLMAKYPPSPADSPLLAQLASINIGAGKIFSMEEFDGSTRDALKKLPAEVHAGLRKAFTQVGSLENGWNVVRSGIGSYGTHYDLRALIALIGLGANLNEDASYPNCVVDANGEKLSGQHRYVIRFEKGETPPVKAFWSITMYDKDEYLVANPINRFAIGDRDKLTFNADGSLDIYVQHENPGKEKESNWLPAPKDAFSLTLRLYWPEQAFLDGTWKIPPVKKVP